jgi:hypothetical protein
VLRHDPAGTQRVQHACQQQLGRACAVACVPRCLSSFDCTVFQASPCCVGVGGCVRRAGGGTTADGSSRRVGTARSNSVTGHSAKEAWCVTALTSKCLLWTDTLGLQTGDAPCACRRQAGTRWTVSRTLRSVWLISLSVGPHSNLTPTTNAGRLSPSHTSTTQTRTSPDHQIKQRADVVRRLTSHGASQRRSQRTSGRGTRHQ